MASVSIVMIFSLMATNRFACSYLSLRWSPRRSQTARPTWPNPPSLCMPSRAFNRTRGRRCNCWSQSMASISGPRWIQDRLINSLTWLWRMMSTSPSSPQRAYESPWPMVTAWIARAAAAIYTSSSAPSFSSSTDTASSWLHLRWSLGFSGLNP
jgi:hypothetical protein